MHRLGYVFRRGQLPLFVVLTLLCAPAWGVVLHPGDEAGPPDRPSDAVVGRFSDNASAVAIAPNYILTTRHQGGGNGTPVWLNGQEYRTRANFRPEDDPNFTFSKADIRIIHIVKPDTLEPANLTDFVDVFSGSNENGRQFVVGGFGKARGDLLPGGHGYSWSGTTNDTLRWGANKVNAVGLTLDLNGFTTKSIRADFDDAGVPTSVDFEAAIAEWDSGGGWFIKEAGVWKVAGLTSAVEHGVSNESWFDPPDNLYAARVSHYAAWIADHLLLDIMPPGDANYDTVVDELDLEILSGHYGKNNRRWVHGDFNGDGWVNVLDLAIMAQNWDAGAGEFPGLDDIDFVPEPSSLAVLLIGAGALARRKRNSN